MRSITACCVALIVILGGVVVVANLQPLRFVLLTAPAWIAVALSVREASIAKWAALPLFIVWLCLMILDWVYLSGWTPIFFMSGGFSAIEILFTFVIGVVSAIGAVLCLTSRARSVGWTMAAPVFIASAALQVVAFRVSMLPWAVGR